MFILYIEHHRYTSSPTTCTHWYCTGIENRTTRELYSGKILLNKQTLHPADDVGADQIYAQRQLHSLIAPVKMNFIYNCLRIGHTRLSSVSPKDNLRQ